MRKTEEQLSAVQKMQDYISAHLYEELTLAALAKACFFSPWYAYRLFCECTGLSPSDYIRRLRLSKSALRLRDEQIKITEVAFDVGFNSVDGYQRAFFKEFGCNPREYAQKPVPLYLFVPYGVKYNLNKEKTMKEIKNVFVQLTEKPARKVLIKRGKTAKDYMEYCDEVGCEIWGLLLSIKTKDEPVCMWLPEKYIKSGTSTYVQGVEVSLDYDGVIPEGFDVIDLPAAKYLKFIGEPFAEEDFMEAIDNVWTAIKKFNPDSIGLSWDNENPRIQLEPRGERGYIELLAVK